MAEPEHWAKRNALSGRKPQRSASHWKDKDIPKHVHRTLRYCRKWRKGPPLPGTRPVADPLATCVICKKNGADWYGSAGDAVHLECFRKSLKADEQKGLYNACE